MYTLYFQFSELRNLKFLILPLKRTASSSHHFLEAPNKRRMVLTLQIEMISYILINSLKKKIFLDRKESFCPNLVSQAMQEYVLRKPVKWVRVGKE